MRIATLLSASSLAFSFTAFAQDDSIKTKDLDPVVVTGQYKPQSLRSSVYQVRVVSSERIRLSGASNVQQLLNNQLGFRFSNDNTLGVADVQVMGIAGRNVKVLLDGVPVNDRNDARESLGQIDVNTIERIEIVEGPMSVTYGSDALAGVINIITKKAGKEQLSIKARIQEETAGNEYHPFSYKGVHLQNVSANLAARNWYGSAGFTHQEFDGFGGDAYGRGKSWLPKEQWFGNVKVGYRFRGFDIYYRADGLNETIKDRELINMLNYKAVDKKYESDRLIHQLQSNWNINARWQWSNTVSYTDYSRKTTTTIHDFEHNTTQLSTASGAQDLSKLQSILYRSTAQFKASEKLSIQPGIEYNRERASGQRIEGTPAIDEYAVFASAEYQPTSRILIRPGVRMFHNSVYDAPPVIPSLNTKFILSKTLDVRLAYARGFRSPELRELYFIFNDANHNIYGNTDLKAERSNSFTGSLHLTPKATSEIALATTLSGFYNVYEDRIDLAQDANDATRYSYFNIDKAKTAGGAVEQTIARKNLRVTAGFSYIGFYSRQFEDKSYVREDERKFLWSPELNSNITYTIPVWKTSFGLFYKYNGNRPFFSFGTNTSGQTVVYVATTKSYHLADFTITTTPHKAVTVQAGIKNLFDVTNVNSTASSSAHTPGGPQPIAFGRSYFLGVTLGLTKK